MSTAGTHGTARFVGRVVAVTGAGSGIGRECATGFALEGAQVVCADIDIDAATETARSQSDRMTPVRVDVTMASGAERLVSAADALGGADILVNSAGVFEVATVVDTDDVVWQRHLDVNLTGTFRCARAVVGAMRARGRGSIVNIASIAGLVSFPANAAYSASKGGVVLLTRNMAIDYAADGVRVNCVCPYSIDGPMMQRYFDAQEDPASSRTSLAEGTPMRRLGTTREVARAVLFLASDEASYITGVALPIDGGYSAT